MCGIAGILSSEKTSPTHLHRLVERMGSAHAYRGPDGHGVWADDQVGLGCVRLQITGDAVAGRQPIHDPWGGVLVFNGEVYQHARVLKELGEPSSEADGIALAAILATRGPDELRRVRGMFAAAHYNPVRRSLLLVRDCVGKKPLYVRRFEGGWAFASTLAALQAGTGGIEMRPEALYEYLVFRSVGGIHSAFKDIEQVPPGSWCEILADGSVRSGRWWTPPDHCSHIGTPEEVRAQIDDAVAARAWRDHEIAVFLSGGLDSSIVAASMRRQIPGQPVRLLSVGYDVEGPEDERSMARQFASSLALPLDEIRVRADDVPGLMERVAVLTEDPIQDPVTLPTLALATEAAGRTKVVMTGDGSDEVWGGYDRFDAVIGGNGDLGNAGYHVLQSYLPHTTVFEPNELGLEEFPASYFSGVDIAGQHLAPLDFVLRFEVANRMRNYHLARIDKITMGMGLEARCPFLDVNVVDVGLSIPSRIKRVGGKTKALLSNAFPELPKWLRERRKQAFTVPILAWLRGPLRQFGEDTLMDRSSFVNSFTNPEVYLRMLRAQHPDAPAAALKTWSLLQLEIWHRHFVSRMGRSTCQSTTT